MVPIAVWSAVAGVFGLAIGSFLNVVIYRVPAGLSVVHPPSHCPVCKNTIPNRYNVPVFGWLALHGRCHDCGTSISARYPLVEGATGIAFVAVTASLLAVHHGGLLPAGLVAVAALITVGMIAFDEHRAR